MTSATRRIAVTYAYHPASNAPDLVLPTTVVGAYVVSSSRGKPMTGEMAALRSSVRAAGIQDPLSIVTDGACAVLTDGYKRYRLAVDAGITEIPVQVLPDNMRRRSARYGRPALEPVLREWIEANLFVHETHDVHRVQVGSRTGNLGSSAFLKCTCSCGASWREEA